MESYIPSQDSYRGNIYNSYRMVIDNLDLLLPSIDNNPDVDVDKNLRLKDIDSKLFLSGSEGYNKQCELKRRPREINQNKIENLDNSMFMKYPLYGESDTRIYSCEHIKDYPYIGLQANKMVNKNIFAYIPCCFKTSQLDRQKKRYLYENADIVNNYSATRKTNMNLYKSLKSVKRNSSAVLPELIKKFLIIISGAYITDNQDLFNREGSIENYNSVLDAIIKALINFYNHLDKNDQAEYKSFITSNFSILESIFNNYKQMSESDVVDYLQQVRLELINFVFLNFTSQSTYNLEYSILLKKYRGCESSLYIIFIVTKDKDINMERLL